MKCSMQIHPEVNWQREGNSFACVTLANKIIIIIIIIIIINFIFIASLSLTVLGALQKMY